MKIKALKVDGYKSLKNFNVSGLNDVNLVCGLNNSGKSNILKFLHMLFSTKETRSEESYVEQGTEKKRIKKSAEHPFYEAYVYEPYIFWMDKRQEGDITFTIDMSIENNDILNSKDLIANGLLNPNREDTHMQIVGFFKSETKSMTRVELSEVTLYDKIIFKNPTGMRGAGQYFPDKNLDTKVQSDSSLYEEIMADLTDCICFIDGNRSFEPELLQRNAEIMRSNTFKSWIYEQYINSDKYDAFRTLVDFINKIEISGNLTKKNKALVSNLKSFPFNNTKIGFTTFSDVIELMFEVDAARLPLQNFGTGIQQLFSHLSKIKNVTWDFNPKFRGEEKVQPCHTQI